MISEPSLVLNKHKYEWFYYNSRYITWRPDGLFIELLQMCDLQLIVVVYWLLESILRICLIFTSVVFYSYEPDHISANSPMNLLFLALRTFSLISPGRVSCLKVLTSYSYGKRYYILAKELVKHEPILFSLSFHFRFCYGNLCSNNLEQPLPPTNQTKQYGNKLSSDCVCAHACTCAHACVWRRRLAALFLRARVCYPKN